MFALLSLLATVLFIAVGGLVGARLILLAWRTRLVPELLVGAALFVIAAVGYPPLVVVGLADLSLELARIFVIAGTIALAIGWLLMLWFTQRVFRPGRGHAWVLCWIASAAIGVLTGAEVLDQAHEVELASLRDLGPAMLWLEVIAVATYGWTSFEGFREYGTARRRAALGLADALVADRFRLWGCIGLGSVVSLAPGIALTLRDASVADSDGTRLVTGLAGLFCSVALQLAFMPPASYRRWIEGRAARAA